METKRTIEEIIEYIRIRTEQIDQWNRDNDLNRAETLYSELLERAYVGQGAKSMLEDLRGFLAGEIDLEDECLL